MASKYERGKVWWVKWRDQAGKVRREPTAYRVGTVFDRRRVEELVARRALEEKTMRGPTAHEHWDKWVVPFLEERYRHNPKTLAIMRGTWTTVRGFLRENKIDFPRQLTRELCLQYLPWRVTPGQWRGKYAACRNTAITELVRLGSIMREAVHRGLATSNPCRELQLRRDPWREKPAFDAGMIAVVRRNIAAMPEGKRKEFFSNSFEIARYHGCRFSETHCNPQTAVGVDATGRWVIRFKAKGNRVHPVPLHPALIPLFEKLRAERRTETYTMPKAATKLWYNFFCHIGLKQTDPNVCFHALRVTVATELAEAGVHEAKARRYLGHASPTVHRVYQRMSIEHMDDVQGVIR